MKALKMNNVMLSVSRAANRALLTIKKYSPEILTTTAVVSTVGAVVTAVYSTMTLEQAGVLDEFRENKEKLEDGKEIVESGQYDYHEEDLQHDTIIVYTKAAWSITKHYLPTIAFTSIAVGSILGLYKVTKARYLALLAAYTSTKTAFEKYREQVKEELKNVDLDEDAVEHDIREDAAKKQLEDHSVPCRVGMENHSMYARWFDESSLCWNRDGSQNLLFLRMIQNMANDKLKARGHVFLNEVYEMLGLPHSREGAVVGWVWCSEHGDNYIDFNLYNKENGSARDFINGWEKSVLLDFNVDGVIYDLI